VSVDQNVEVVLEAFSAIERRDDQRFLDLLHPDFEILWPSSLPYGKSSPGRNHQVPTWSEIWNSLQPSDAERRMDPRVVAHSADEVVVLWHQRGVTSGGNRFDGEVLGLYRVRDAKLARAQMFYFDTAAVASFLAQANAPED
jgi:ketosteroid isomerase-like protein